MDESLIVAIVMVTAAVIAFELRVSSAILEILAGIGLAFFFVDIAQLDWLRFLSNLGMLGLMFMVGFEVDVERLRGTWRASIAIGVSALLLPLTGVFCVAYFIFGLAPLSAGPLASGLSTISWALVLKCPL